MRDDGLDSSPAKGARHRVADRLVDNQWDNAEQRAGQRTGFESSAPVRAQQSLSFCCDRVGCKYTGGAPISPQTERLLIGWNSEILQVKTPPEEFLFPTHAKSGRLPTRRMQLSAPTPQSHSRSC